MERKTFRADFDIKQLKEMLSNNITGPNKELLVETIVSIAQDHHEDHNCSALLMSCLGVKPVVDYHVGDGVDVNIFGISTWDWDKAAMQIHKLLTVPEQGGEIVSAGIVDVNPYSYNQYKIKYSYMNKSDDRPTITGTQWMKAEYIVGYTEEWPIQ